VALIDHPPWMIFTSTGLTSFWPRCILPHCPECCTVPILQLNRGTNKTGDHTKHKKAHRYSQ